MVRWPQWIVLHLAHCGPDEKSRPTQTRCQIRNGTRKSAESDLLLREGLAVGAGTLCQRAGRDTGLEWIDRIVSVLLIRQDYKRKSDRVARAPLETQALYLFPSRAGSLWLAHLFSLTRSHASDSWESVNKPKKKQPEHPFFSLERPIDKSNETWYFNWRAARAHSTRRDHFSRRSFFHRADDNSRSIERDATRIMCALATLGSDI